MTKLITIQVEAPTEGVDLIDFATKIKGILPLGFDITMLAVLKKRGKETSSSPEE